MGEIPTEPSITAIKKEDTEDYSYSVTWDKPVSPVVKWDPEVYNTQNSAFEYRAALDSAKASPIHATIEYHVGEDVKVSIDKECFDLEKAMLYEDCSDLSGSYGRCRDDNYYYYPNQEWTRMPDGRDANSMVSLSTGKSYQIVFYIRKKDQSQECKDFFKSESYFPVYVNGALAEGTFEDRLRTGYAYNFTIPTYNITFVNGEAETTISVAYGELPTAPAEVPTKAATAKYTYTFKGWDPEIAVVTGEATYTAVFDSVLNAYKVTFLDFNGSELKADSVEYGKAATDPADPKRKGYKFTGWDKEFDNIVADLEVIAQYEKLSESSSSVTSSSSTTIEDLKNSSSSATKPESSSSVKPNSSSSAKPDFIFAGSNVPQFHVEVIGHNLQISGARIGSRYAIMDMQGRILNVGSINATNVNMNISRAGSYMVRVGNQTLRVNVK